MMNEHRLAGLRSHHYSSLLSYLAALGTFRVLSSQADKDARMHWDSDIPVIATTLTEEEFVDFFLMKYAPSPIISPWNGGNPLFRDKENISDIMNSKDNRFKCIQHSITLMYKSYFGIIEKYHKSEEGQENSTGKRLNKMRIELSSILNTNDLCVLTEQIAENIDEIISYFVAKETKIKKELVGEQNKQIKSELIDHLRSSLPNEAIYWIDANATISSDKRMHTSPLLLSGGNDGNLDLSTQFIEHLSSIILKSQDSLSENWLLSSCFGTQNEVKMIAGKSTGYLDSHGVGGMNSAPGSDKKLLNPWTYVLALEGTLMFACSIVRRMDSLVDRPTAPFSIKAGSPVGHSSSTDGESLSKGELWLPHWKASVGLHELNRLFSEGRMEWNGKQSHNGIDTVRAAATLGTERGIQAFERFAILERRGQSNSALRVDRIFTAELPEIKLTSQLDSWINSLSGINLSSVAFCKYQIERSIYELSKCPHNSALRASLLADYLSSVAMAEVALGRINLKEREKVQPIRYLNPNEWIDYLQDDTPEMRIAIGFASLHDRAKAKRALTLANYFRPIEINNGRIKGWREKGTLISGIDSLKLNELITNLLAKRVLDVFSIGDERFESEISQKGILIGFKYGMTVPIEDILDLYFGNLNEERIAKLISGLLLLDWSKLDYNRFQESNKSSPSNYSYLPTEWCILVRFFDHLPIDGGVRLTASTNWGLHFQSNKIDELLSDALQRLKIAGLRPSVEKVIPHWNYVHRLAMTLLLKAPAQILGRAFNQVTYRETISEEITA